jgi:hypothetical protein
MRMVEGLAVWKMRLELDDQFGIDGSRRIVLSEAW